MVTPLHQVCAEVGPDKPRASRDQDAVPLDPRLCLNFGLAVRAQGGLGVAGMDLQNAETASCLCFFPGTNTRERSWLLGVKKCALSSSLRERAQHRRCNRLSETEAGGLTHRAIACSHIEGLIIVTPGLCYRSTVAASTVCSSAYTAVYMVGRSAGANRELCKARPCLLTLTQSTHCSWIGVRDKILPCTTF